MQRPPRMHAQTAVMRWRLTVCLCWALSCAASQHNRRVSYPAHDCTAPLYFLLQSAAGSAAMHHHFAPDQAGTVRKQVLTPPAFPLQAPCAESATLAEPAPSLPASQQVAATQ